MPLISTSGSVRRSETRPSTRKAAISRAGGCRRVLRGDELPDAGVYVMLKGTLSKCIVTKM